MRKTTKLAVWQKIGKDKPFLVSEITELDEDGELNHGPIYRLIHQLLKATKDPTRLRVLRGQEIIIDVNAPSQSRSQLLVKNAKIP